MISSVLPVYNRIELEIDYGEGPYIYTKDKKRYIDFVSGVAVNCLGHCHPKLIDALTEQSKKMWHVSNFFTPPGLKEFAQKLIDNTFADTLFFCNSGTEAIECCIKTVRKYQNFKGKPNKYHIITFEGAFHGRTLAALWASKRDALMQDGFGPPIQGFHNIPFNDIEAVKNAITEDTGAILIEPIQGDGGIRPTSKEFLQELRKICNENDILLCFDEVQSGIGRSGKLFAYELSGVEPDIMTSAKGIGGGFPLGACLMNEKASSGMTIGTHGSTYGGNPLAMAVGNAVLDEILSEGFLENVTQLGIYLNEGLNKIAAQYPNVISEIRGIGLMQGIKFVENNKEVSAKLVELGLLLPAAADNILRVLPPLNITKYQLDEALEIIEKLCQGG